MAAASELASLSGAGKGVITCSQSLKIVNIDTDVSMSHTIPSMMRWNMAGTDTATACG